VVEALAATYDNVTSMVQAVIAPTAEKTAAAAAREADAKAVVKVAEVTLELATELVAHDRDQLESSTKVLQESFESTHTTLVAGSEASTLEEAHTALARAADGMTSHTELKAQTAAQDAAALKQAAEAHATHLAELEVEKQRMAAQTAAFREGEVQRQRNRASELAHTWASEEGAFVHARANDRNQWDRQHAKDLHRLETNLAAAMAELADAEADAEASRVELEASEQNAEMTKALMIQRLKDEHETAASNAVAASAAAAATLTAQIASIREKEAQARTVHAECEQALLALGESDVQRTTEHEAAMAAAQTTWTNRDEHEDECTERMSTLQQELEEARSSLLDAQAAVKTLSDTIAEEQQAATTANAVREQDLNEKRNAAALAAADTASMNEADLHAEVEDTQSQHSSVQVSLKDLEATLGQLRTAEGEAKAEHEAALADVQTTWAGYSEKVAEWAATKEALEKDIAEANDALCTLQAAVEAARECLAKDESASESTRTMRAQELSRSCNESMIEATKAAEDTQADLQSQLLAVHAEHTEVKTALADYEAKRTTLRGDEEAKTIEHAAALATANVNWDGCDEKTTMWATATEEFERSLATAQAELATAKAAIETAQNDVAEAEQVAQRANDARAFELADRRAGSAAEADVAATATATNLQAQVSAVHADHKEATSALAELEATCTSMQAAENQREEEHEAALATVDTTWSDRDARTAEWTANTQALEGELATAQGELLAVQTAIQAAELTHSTMARAEATTNEERAQELNEKRLAAATEAGNAAARTEAELQNEIAALQTDQTKAQADLDEMNVQLTTLQATAEESQAQHAVTLDSIEWENSDKP
jgi:chromosome segregation ATPase